MSEQPEYQSVQVDAALVELVKPLWGELLGARPAPAGRTWTGPPAGEWSGHSRHLPPSLTLRQAIHRTSPGRQT